MAKVRRFSGNLKMELSFNDRSNQYKVRVCPKVRGEKCATVFVRPPRALERAVDSPRAYDQAARAAISFAPHDLQDYAEMTGGKIGTWRISRGRRTYAKGHPKRRRS